MSVQRRRLLAAALALTAAAPARPAAAPAPLYLRFAWPRQVRGRVYLESKSSTERSAAQATLDVERVAGSGWSVKVVDWKLTELSQAAPQGICETAGLRPPADLAAQLRTLILPSMLIRVDGSLAEADVDGARTAMLDALVDARNRETVATLRSLCEQRLDATLDLLEDDDLLADADARWDLWCRQWIGQPTRLYGAVSGTMRIRLDGEVIALRARIRRVQEPSAEDRRLTLNAVVETSDRDSSGSVRIAVERQAQVDVATALPLRSMERLRVSVNQSVPRASLPAVRDDVDRELLYRFDWESAGS